MYILYDILFEKNFPIGICRALLEVKWSSFELFLSFTHVMSRERQEFDCKVRGGFNM